jgi:regulator of protease activity HflC (stomatin/prohibitin superfamily)
MNGTIIDLGKDFGKKEKTFSTLILGVVALGFLGLQMYHIVPPGHRGISVTLGKVNPAELPEGITFKWPFIQRIQRFPRIPRRTPGKSVAVYRRIHNSLRS